MIESLNVSGSLLYPSQCKALKEKFRPEFVCRGKGLEYYQAEVQCRLVVSNIAFLASEDIDLNHGMDGATEGSDDYPAVSLLASLTGDREAYLNALRDLRAKELFSDAVQVVEQMNAQGVLLDAQTGRELWSLYQS